MSEKISNLPNATLPLADTDLLLVDQLTAAGWSTRKFTGASLAQKANTNVFTTLAAAGGASLIGLQDTAGNFPTDNVEAALATVIARAYGINVLKYGADPTGVADSSAAFASALSVGRNVYAPAGRYKVNLSLVSNDCIVGDGMRRTVLTPVAGATSVILVDASTVAKQNVTIASLCIKNVGSVAGCAGIWYKGDNVLDINDQHNVFDVEIGHIGWETFGDTAFQYGVRVTGRLISFTGCRMYISQCNTGWNSITDPSTPAFNANLFEQCVFQECAAQGFIHSGQATNVTFIEGYTQQNNTSNAAGVAGMDLSNVFNVGIHEHGFEANGESGGGVAVDAANALNNSIGLRINGTICQNLVVQGCYFTSSGADIVIDSTVTNMSGGRISDNFLNCKANGFSFACLATGANPGVQNQLIFSTTNNTSGKITTAMTTGTDAVMFEQGKGMQYVTSAINIDLLRCSQLICNPGGPFTLSNVANMLPGLTLTVANYYGASTVTIAGALMQGGVASAVLTGTVARFMVLGAPFAGLFVRV